MSNDYLNTPPPELFAKCYEQAERQLQSDFSLKFVMSHAIRTAYDAGHAKGSDHIGQVNKMVTSSLVERVAEAMQPGTFDWSAYEGEARAAIREVAAWLREAHGWEEGAQGLEREAER